MKNMTLKQLNTAIQNIAINGKVFDQSVQDAALNVLVHVEAKREVSLANKLFKALPKGARKNALAEFFLQNGKISANIDKATNKDRPFVFDDKKITNLVNAESKPWFKHMKEKTVAEAFDPDKFIAMVQSKLKKQAESGTLPADERLMAILALPVKAVA